MDKSMSSDTTTFFGSSNATFPSTEAISHRSAWQGLFLEISLTSRSRQSLTNK
jgi:hypothetical protein